MPSLEHEAVVMLLTKRPSLLVELLRDALGDLVPEDASIALGPDTLRSLQPIEVRADAVLVLEGPRSKLAMVTEVQLRDEPSKRAVLPAYVSLVHRNLGCPTLLVIVTLDPDVARKWHEPIQVSPRFVLHPLVVGPDEVPRVVDPLRAAENLELAVLSALAHGGRAPPEEAAAIGEAALQALAETERVDEDRAADYADVVLEALGRAAYRLLEEKMRSQGHRYRSQFAREFFDKGLEEGEARALFEVLAARGIAVDDAFVERVRGCTDVELLATWIRRAVTAGSLADVFDA